MNWSKRQTQILQWACDGPGIDSTSRECDASQDELLNLIARLESELYDYNKLVLQERKWKLRWKRWASWAWNLNYSAHDDDKSREFPAAAVRRAKAKIKQICR